ncbi:MAG: DUF167 domain-containing protein [Bryobacterales bacterium]
MGRITLRVQPGAAKRRVAGKVGEEWKIAVTAPPVDGKANQASIELVAEVCGTAKSAVALVAGATARRKVFEVEGKTPEELEAAFRAAGATAR